MLSSGFSIMSARVSSNNYNTPHEQLDYVPSHGNFHNRVTIAYCIMITIISFRLSDVDSDPRNAAHGRRINCIAPRIKPILKQFELCSSKVFSFDPKTVQEGDQKW